MGGSKVEGETSKSGVPAVTRRDLYEVLNVSKEASDQEIKSSYRKLALKHHPDKNANNPDASEIFKEIAFSYAVLSNPEKRSQYDNSGFEAIDADSKDMEIDLSNLGTMSKLIAALFSKLGVPIKTTISVNVLEEAMTGSVKVKHLSLGSSIKGKVDKQSAHFFDVTVTEEEARAGIVVRVTSAAQNRFKLLYFEEEIGVGYDLALEEDSEKTGKVTSAGMYFLHFQVYRIDARVNALAMAKDPKLAVFKMLEGLQPCEVSEIKAGTHRFAVYGDNFFKTAHYTIEAICAATYESWTQKLKDIEQQILSKRTKLRQFETEYRKALEQNPEATNRHTQEKQNVEELLKQRENIQSSFTSRNLVKLENKASNGSNNREVSSSLGEDRKDKSAKNKWSNLKLNLAAAKKSNS